MEWQKGEYTICTELSEADLEAIHGHLETYWKLGTPFQILQKAFHNSLAFGVFHGELLVGWARVITDGAVIAYLADVFVLETYRGRGLARWLMECVLAHPELQGLRRWLLSTEDSHGLYAPFGFGSLSHPEHFMERFDPQVYKG